jgi:hypothetical protein
LAGSGSSPKREGFEGFHRDFYNRLKISEVGEQNEEESFALLTALTGYLQNGSAASFCDEGEPPPQ